MSIAIQALAQAINNHQAAVLATIVETKGASPAKIGAQIVLLPGGKTAGTVGGGKLEAEILKAAGEALETKSAGLRQFALAEEGQDAIGTLCGGEVTAYVQAYFPPPQLVIVGGGHIGRPLRIIGEAAGFDVVVVDVAAGKDQVPELEEINLTNNSYVVLITTDHVSDEAAMRIALKTPAPYIGMIGSLAKWCAIRGHLTTDEYTYADLSRVFAPIGVDLGGPTPQEIAVAIMAEVVAVRHQQVKENSIPLRRLST